MTAAKIFLLLSTFLFLNFVNSNNLVGSECRLKTNERGICAGYKNCKDLIDKLKSHDIEFKDIVHCDSYLVVCCPLSIPNTPVIPAPQEISIKTRISEESK